MRKTGLLLCVVLLLAIVIVSGCTSSGSSPMATQTPPTSGLAKDPIVGAWRNIDAVGHDARFRFDPDGTYAVSSYRPANGETTVIYGTWMAQGGDTYLLREEGTRAPRTITYAPDQNGLYFDDVPVVLYVPYEGDVMAASSHSG